MSGVTTKEQAEYENVYCASGYTQGAPYVLDFDSSAHCAVALVPATLAIEQRIGIPQGPTTTAAGHYPFQVKGYCMARVNGTANIADGGFLEVINGGTALISDHDTVRTAGSVAVSCYGAAFTATTSALCPVFLIGDTVTVAGS